MRPQQRSIPTSDYLWSTYAVRIMLPSFFYFVSNCFPRQSVNLIREIVDHAGQDQGSPPPTLENNTLTAQILQPRDARRLPPPIAQPSTHTPPPSSALSLAQTSEAWRPTLWIAWSHSPNSVTSPPSTSQILRKISSCPAISSRTVAMAGLVRARQPTAVTTAPTTKPSLAEEGERKES